MGRGGSEYYWILTCGEMMRARAGSVSVDQRSMYSILNGRASMIVGSDDPLRLGDAYDSGAPEERIEHIRKVFPILLRDGGLQYLGRPYPGQRTVRSFRGKLWSLFLTKNTTSPFNPQEAVRTFRPATFCAFKEKVDEEFARIQKSRPDILDVVGSENYKCWLWHYGIWELTETRLVQKPEVKTVFYQNLSTVGTIFMKHFSVDAAFPRFV